MMIAKVAVIGRGRTLTVTLSMPASGVGLSNPGRGVGWRAAEEVWLPPTGDTPDGVGTELYLHFSLKLS